MTILAQPTPGSSGLLRVAQDRTVPGQSRIAVAPRPHHGDDPDRVASRVKVDSSCTVKEVGEPILERAAVRGATELRHAPRTAGAARFRWDRDKPCAGRPDGF